MKIVLVTGRKAYEYVKKIVEENPVPGAEIHIVEMPVDVAAFITIEDLLDELPKRLSLDEKPDLVIVPGYVQGDLHRVSERISVRTVKGVKNARDIPLMIKTIMQGVYGSESEAYDEFLHSFKARRDYEVLERARNRARVNKFFDILGVPISRDFPVVFAEIVVSESDEIGEVLRRTSKIVSHGADVIVYGTSGDIKSHILLDLIKQSKSLFEKPVGIDSSSRDLLWMLKDYIDVYLSIYPNEISSLTVPSDIAVTVIPREPDSIHELIEATCSAASKGLRKIILDPILQPPLLGLSKSLQRYFAVREQCPNYPLLMGIGNVVELIDADSIGVLALLASLGVEMGVEVYLATEASVKTRRAVYELRRALDMAVISRETGGSPKDLSIDLLVAKSKRESGYRPRLVQDRIINARERLRFSEDPKGHVRVSLDHFDEEIILEHYEPGRAEPTLIIKGKDPLALAKEIVDRELVSKMEHAIYIGIEIGKAYRALMSGAEYEQE